MVNHIGYLIFMPRHINPTYVYFKTTPAGSILSVERMRIDANGDMGIGITTPTSKLDVAGDIEIGSTNAFYMGDPTTDGSWRIIKNGANLEFQNRIDGVWITANTILAPEVLKDNTGTPIKDSSGTNIFLTA